MVFTHFVVRKVAMDRVFHKVVHVSAITSYNVKVSDIYCIYFFFIFFLIIYSDILFYFFYIREVTLY